MPRRISSQQHRPVQERRGRRHPAPGLRPARRLLELDGDLLVRPSRGLGPVPGPAIRIGLRIGHLRQRRVHLPPLGQRRRPVRRGTQQRMPEAHPAAELGQPRLYGRRRILDGDAEPPGRPPHQRPVSRRIGRCQLQQPPGLIWESLQLTPEAVLDPARQGSGARQPEPARQLRGGQPARQLKQRQRITTCLRHDQVADLRVQRPGQGRVQERPRIIVPQPFDAQLGQPGQIDARLAGREHHAHRIGRQPPRRESQRLRRSLIEPLLVVDHADQRTFPGRPGQQAQHGQPDQESVRRRARGDAERGPQRVPLRHRQTLRAIQHRRAQLMQPRERQLHLRLHARGALHPAPRTRRLPGQVVQQHGLAHARVATHHQSPALTAADRVDELIERGAFAVPVRQRRHAATPP